MQGLTKVLPLDASGIVDAGSCFNLWAAHASSGVLDPDNVSCLTT